MLYFSPLPRFNFGVYADWKLARKPRLILHATVTAHIKENEAITKYNENYWWTNSSNTNNYGTSSPFYRRLV